MDAANQVTTDAPRNTLLVGDCLELLRSLPANSVDAVVTDPPAGISLFGLEWDGDKGGRDAWVGWMTEVMTECLRVLKPGGHAFVWSFPRTAHWTGWAIENAGFEIRDFVPHVFPTGMPKFARLLNKVPGMEGWVLGTLKPAHEDWWLARKPFRGSGVANVLRYGTGGLNIAASRIAGPRGDGVWGSSNATCAPTFNGSPSQHDYRSQAVENEDGRVLRYPPNLVITDAPIFDDPNNPFTLGAGRSKGGAYPTQRGKAVTSAFGVGQPTPGGARKMGDDGGKSRYFMLPESNDEDWNEIELDLWLADVAADAGREPLPAETDDYPRFLLAAKASRVDRETGVNGKRLSRARDGKPRNTHASPKSLELMKWLITAITPPHGLVLDPFSGSGSTLVAAAKLGFDYLGIEKDPAYAAIARARLELAEPGAAPEEEAA